MPKEILELPLRVVLAHVLGTLLVFLGFWATVIGLFAVAPSRF